MTIALVFTTETPPAGTFWECSLCGHKHELRKDLMLDAMRKGHGLNKQFPKVCAGYGSKVEYLTPMYSPYWESIIPPVSGLMRSV